MKIIRYLVNFAKKVAASRTAQIFFFIHLTLLITALMQKATMQQTIQPVDFEYELLLYKILTLINLPGTVLVYILLLPFILVGILLLAFMQFASVNIQMNSDNSQPLVIFAYIGWQIQWVMIGYWIENLFRRKREKLS